MIGDLLLQSSKVIGGFGTRTTSELAGSLLALLSAPFRVVALGQGGSWETAKRANSRVAKAKREALSIS